MSRRTKRLSCASVAIAAALYAGDAGAQFYLGAEGGWTGLEGTKSSVTGTNPLTGQTSTVSINQSFNDGFNVGARAGYQWNSWRFEGEYGYRQNSSNATVAGAKINGT